MALIIDLKPNERVIIGNALVTNNDKKASIHIEGNTPVLREKEVMRQEMADSPCKKIYFALQLLYLSPETEKVHKPYFDLVRDVQMAAPSTTFFFAKINDHILDGDYYKAMREAHNLVDHEQELIAYAS